MTWHSEAYILRTVAELSNSRLELLFHELAGVDGHQDVFAFHRVE
jgi:hypothetical protein